MPSISLDISVTAGEAVRVQAAYQSAANVSVNGTASQAQVLGYLKAKIRQQIIDDVRGYEKSVALAAVVDPPTINPS